MPHKHRSQHNLINKIAAIGKTIIFLGDVFRTLSKTQLKVKKIIQQIDHIGIESSTIVILTGTFAGAVLALQTYVGLQRFGTQDFLGPIVALCMTRELGPVLTGLMVSGRAGSAIAAQISTMRITEQIDALHTVAINPIQYLIVPRMLAGVIVLPLLTLLAMFFGILGGYIVAVFMLDLNGQQYIYEIQNFVQLGDICGGMIKGSFFGFILTWIGSYKGYYTTDGARGVGQATTQTVVISSILILITNYFLASLLFES